MTDAMDEAFHKILIGRQMEEMAKLNKNSSLVLPATYKEEKPKNEFIVSLDAIAACELSAEFEPPNELVQGLITCGSSSVFYGNSNSGKTFLAIDMGCAIARGVDWLGKKTEKGIVIYLACESPSSVKSRLQAYQQYYGVRIENFFIVSKPIDLFRSNLDADLIIRFVKFLEETFAPLKVRLIIGDTLARMSVGANENSAQDMGELIRRVDYIRNETGVHFATIHHTGKDESKGARGSTAIRAAADTEIEITDKFDGRCAEIMKQRDLSTNHERIGFKLEPVELGLTKWNEPATSCVVLNDVAPEKPKNKKPTAINGAIHEYLFSVGKPLKKTDIVDHFIGRYKKGPIYRELKNMVSAQIITDYRGEISLIITT